MEGKFFFVSDTTEALWEPSDVSGGSGIALNYFGPNRDFIMFGGGGTKTCMVWSIEEGQTEITKTSYGTASGDTGKYDTCITTDNGYWDNLTSHREMFQSLSGIKSFGFTKSWTLRKTSSIAAMFQNCTSLEEINLPSANIEDQNIESWGFCKNCTNLKRIEFGGSFPMSLNSFEIFSGCSNLTNVDFLKGSDTTGVFRSSKMFENCGSLNSISGLSDFTPGKKTNSSLTYVEAQQMFDGCSSLEDISPLGSWDMSLVSQMSYFFNNCTSLTDISPLADWDLASLGGASKSGSGSGAFYGCTNLRDFSPLDGWSKKSWFTDRKPAFKGFFLNTASGARLPNWTEDFMTTN